MDGGTVYSSAIYSHQGRKWLLSKRQSLNSAKDNQKYSSYQSTHVGHNDSSDTGKIVTAATKLFRIKKLLSDAKSTKKITSHPYLDMLSEYIKSGKEIVVKQPQKTLFELDLGEYHTMLQDLNIAGKTYHSNSVEEFEKVIYQSTDKIVYTPMLTAKQVATLISLSSALAQGQRDEKKQVEALFMAKSLLDSSVRVTSHVTAPVIAWHMADHKVSCTICGLKFSNTRYKSLHHEKNHQKVKKMTSNWLSLTDWIEKSSEIYSDQSHKSTQLTMNSLRELWSTSVHFKWLDKIFQFDESLDVIMEDDQDAVTDHSGTGQKCNPLELLNAWAIGDNSLTDHIINNTTFETTKTFLCDPCVCDFSDHLCVICGDSFDISYSHEHGSFVLDNALPLLRMTPLHVKRNSIPNPNLSWRLWKKFGLNLYGDYWSYTNCIPTDVKYAHTQCFNFMSIYDNQSDGSIVESNPNSLKDDCLIGTFEKAENTDYKKRKINLQDVKHLQI
ncbi:hypothetical protein BmR1_04g09250 [Babesia microti strain RI]|uniref:C2H2-type domain-containing protein n=1 Tax=Babesia microti (strain RI) TaxID=1133968 RepID=I7J9S0_BABMR|nr:hypothetical protein BmR1_04g09250 [Babesia microti strain RI]CCF76023.1 hypothetical protein BmR1_04g09250 [Babesia microti strain RI]|eukprot:XP_012650431.1 hypothetical protein BmR1_04g09250 [Babesia microti strain RI]